MSMQELHETVDSLLDTLQMKFEALQARLAAVEAERDAARAGEARAVEALRRCHEGAARQLAEPRDHDGDQYALTAIATDCEAVLAAQGSVLDWLAQQRREAAAMIRERGESGWTAQFEREYKGKTLAVVEAGPVGWYWYVDGSADYEAEIAPTLEAAQAAAVAWVDEQEGRDV